MNKTNAHSSPEAKVGGLVMDMLLMLVLVLLWLVVAVAGVCAVHILEDGDKESL